MAAVSRTVGLGAGLICAVAASQAPEFAQQYRQRLGGAIDELRTVVERFDADAASQNLDRQTALRRLSANPDPLAQRRAADASLNAARLSDLERQRSEMQNSGSFGRIVSLVSEADPDVIHGTTAAFEPAVPTTLEGAVAAGGGFVLGYGLIRLLARPFRRRSRLAVRT
jgi:flagellar motility protein MotE (MotC chaperone)